MLLNRSIDIAQFWDWFVDAEDAVEAHGSEAEVELARSVDLRFAEYSSGHIDEVRLLFALERELAESGLAGRRHLARVRRSA